MKRVFACTIAGLILTMIIVSCKKYSLPGIYTNPASQRKVRFQLYTNKNFSEDHHTINFSLFIKHAREILFDSALAPMEIKGIPDAEHKLVIEKTIWVNNNSDLAAGFNYEIQNVGTSFFLDTMKAGNTFKIIDYSFQ